MTFQKLDKVQELKINSWYLYLKNRGLPSDLIDEYISYIISLIDKNLPIIFELEHLSKLLSINYIELLKIINSPENYYREFNIPKRKGGTRNILSPYPSLLHCQKWIYKNILSKIAIHDAAHGFIKKRSIMSNAEKHVEKKCILKMDMSDFFPSIPINWVINFFHSLGYSNNVSFYLSSICCLNNGLPQGGATSPYLSNILLVSLDRRLTNLSKSYKLDYTRYADDMTFSGDYIPLKFSEIVSQIIDNFGLHINNDKTQLITKPGKRIITGVSVAGSKMTLPRDKKREIRKEVHYIKKFGYLSHASKMKIRNPAYLSVLEGKLNFWLQVEPDNEYAKQAIVFIRTLKNI
ncbi:MULTISPECIES: retron St85 family RNA-directed DNA polymerase [Citrobacter]|uniref:RNA-directed DNA polymerase n=1 Tax=Citrobacter telavivensis TaxID=2653932 RepID=A0A6L5EE24_9ENTR|nr:MULTISPECIES: retron St85 family RNA-directed DNA polymerase [Citrobacter]MPQ52820.1 RNA-directed DNA polymerase [Citrobacter telavivensis]QFS70136.1 RNA-directed DNA polymerase [Citrobacter telavivensis]CAI9388471.1 hypothetical protein CITSP_00499 [Citrobacter sp. T1.2D-1]